MEVEVFLHHVLLKDLRGFVVELLEFRLEPARFPKGNYALIRRQNDFFGAILHGFRVNEVAVVVVNDENVLVSTDGRRKGNVWWGPCRFGRWPVGNRRTRNVF